MNVPVKKSRNRQIYELWYDIQDQVGPAKYWPASIRKMFWTQGLKHPQRPLIVAFCYVNGLNPVVSNTLCYVWTINNVRGGCSL